MKNRNKMIYFLSTKKNRKCTRTGKHMLNTSWLLIENESLKELTSLLLSQCFFPSLFDGLKQTSLNDKGKTKEKGHIFTVKYQIIA